MTDIGSNEIKNLIIALAGVLTALFFLTLSIRGCGFYLAPAEDVPDFDPPQDLVHVQPTGFFGYATAVPGHYIEIKPPSGEANRAFEDTVVTTDHTSFRCSEWAEIK